MGFCMNLKPRPDRVLTRAEWEAHMHPTITLNGQPAADYVLNDIDGGGAHVVWPDGRTQQVTSQDDVLILIALDPRYTYDQNRSIIDVEPEYRGEAEAWR